MPRSREGGQAGHLRRLPGQGARKRQKSAEKCAKSARKRQKVREKRRKTQGVIWPNPLLDKVLHLKSVPRNAEIGNARGDAERRGPRRRSPRFHQTGEDGQILEHQQDHSMNSGFPQDIYADTVRTHLSAEQRIAAISVKKGAKGKGSGVRGGGYLPARTYTTCTTCTR